MGDDVGDLPAMRLVGIAVAVADAVPEVRKAAAYVARQFELAGLRAVADRPTRPAWRRDSFFQRFAGAGTS